MTPEEERLKQMRDAAEEYAANWRRNKWYFEIMADSMHEIFGIEKPMAYAMMILPHFLPRPPAIDQETFNKVMKHFVKEAESLDEEDEWKG